MADLRAMLEALGFTDVKSLLNSGNLVFDAGGKSGAALEALLEAETKKRLKLGTPYVVRSVKEWAALVGANPFPKDAKSDPGHLHVVCLKDAAKPAAVKALQAAIKGCETVHAQGKQLYIVYPDGSGHSKLTIGMIEKHLGTTGTARNWNTVLKLAALAAA